MFSHCRLEKVEINNENHKRIKCSFPNPALAVYYILPQFYLHFKVNARNYFFARRSVTCWPYLLANSRQCCQKNCTFV